MIKKQELILIFMQELLLKDNVTSIKELRKAATKFANQYLAERKSK